MRNPQIEWNLADGRRRTLIASNALRSDGVWFFQGVHELTYPARSSAGSLTNPDIVAIQSRTNILAVPEFSETPEQIRSEMKISRLSSIKAAKEAQLSILEILDYLSLHPDTTPQLRALLDTQLHGRLAAAWTPLVVVLMAFPFGALSVRRNVFVGVASSIFICFAFFVLQTFSMALGTGGYLPSLAAAWLPNALFGGAGIWLTARVR